MSSDYLMGQLVAGLVAAGLVKPELAATARQALREGLGLLCERAEMYATQAGDDEAAQHFERARSVLRDVL